MSHLKRVAVLAAGAAITSILIGVGPGTPANADTTHKVSSSSTEARVIIGGRGGGWGRGGWGRGFYGGWGYPGFYGAGYGAYPYSPFYGTGYYGAYNYAPPFYGGWGYGGGW